MAEAENSNELYSKYKAITTLLPYAVLQELNGKPEMLNMFLCAARASKMLWFRWYRIRQFVSPILSKATPHAIILISAHIPWSLLTDRGDLVRQWAVAISTVPYAEEVAQSVVDTLLQIAFEAPLLPRIPIDTWSWLTKRPPLPPVFLGRHLGTHQSIVDAIRGLNDIEVLKSYLLLTWSEWDTLRGEGFNKMCTSIREDFGGVGMGRHRVDLIERLDHILGQLDRGLEYLNQHSPYVDEDNLQIMEQDYRGIKEVLLEVERRTSPLITPLFCTLIPAKIHRVSRNVYVRSSSPVPVVSWLAYLAPVADTILCPYLRPTTSTQLVPSRYMLR